MVEAAALIEDAVASGNLPGAVLATRDGVHVTGRLSTGGAPMTADTVFDLASLTKVVATLPCVLHLVELGEIDLDDPVTRYLPAFDHGRTRVTLRHLLAHTAGLPDSRPFHRTGTTPAERLRAVATAPLTAELDAAMVYTDIGFLLLGLVVEAVTGAGLDDVAATTVFEPLGIASTRYRPPESWWSRCAATEPDGTGVPKIGIVHDENAEALGVLAGHAGLFGTAPDIARYIAVWIDPAARPDPTRSPSGGTALPDRPRRRPPRARLDAARRPLGSHGLGLAADRRRVYRFHRYQRRLRSALRRVGRPADQRRTPRTGRPYRDRAAPSRPRRRGRRLSMSTSTNWHVATARYVGEGGELHVIYRGEVIERGPTDVVITEPVHPYTQCLLSAVPVLHGIEREGADRLIPLAMLDERTRTDGCLFAPRCPFAHDNCHVEHPALMSIDDGTQQHACFYPKVRHVVATEA